MTLKYWEILWNLFSLSNEAVAMTSNQLKLLWKRRNCRQHEINFISIWYFLLKSFNWTRMLLIYELVRCIVIGSYFFLYQTISAKKKENKDCLMWRTHSPNQSFCTQNCSIDIQKAAYELSRDVVNIRNIIFVAGAVCKERNSDGFFYNSLEYFELHISCANCLQFLLLFVQNIWCFYPCFAMVRATTIEYTYT